MPATSLHQPLAIVGVSALFPGSVNATGFWKDILAGRDMISDVPPSHWLVEDYYDADPTKPDKTYAKRGAFLPDVDFDPVSFGIPPNQLAATDTAQLLALIVAQQVLEDAYQGQFSKADRSKISVILGVTSAQELLASMVSRLQRPVWVKGLREAGLPEDEVQAACEKISANYAPWQTETFPGLLGNVVAGRIANRLDLGGTNCVTDAACASTFSAISMAANELYLGQSDLVVAGGADTMNDIFMYMCFSKTPALSKSGDCRPFSDKADGTMLGEGFGMVAIKRLADAERDGDRVYAVLTAVGSSSDGRAKSVYAPVSEGQAKALRRAYDIAGYGTETVELMEAHGTGTKAGDAAEFEGLRMVFEESGRVDRQWCALGSVKSQIGHTKAAAGAAGLFKAVMALHHKVLPPTIKIDQPNPALKIETTPFSLTTRSRPWIRGADHPRRASVSSFGFGGSNFHLALQEYTGNQAAARSRALPSELVLFGAADNIALLGQLDALKSTVGTPDLLPFLAYQSQHAYAAGAGSRLAIVATDEADLAAKLDKARAMVQAGKPGSTPDGIAFGTGAHEGEVAFLFPGQGSQYLDMGAALAMHYDTARRAWDLAANLPFEPTTRLQDVVFPITAFGKDAAEAQEARLTATEWAQPAIGAASLALLGIVRDLGVKPTCVAGHSFGEVIALAAAGVLSESDALRVARERGERMRDAAQKPGAMTAVVAKVEDLRPLLAEWKLDVVVANHNAPQQVVLSGPTDAIAAVEAKLTAAGITAKRLNVATAFHSHVVSDSVPPFKSFLDGIEVHKAEIDVYADATSELYPAKAAAIRAQLGGQIAEPVRFVELIEAMYARGVRTFLEVGPANVLSGLVGKILKGRPHRAIALDRKGKDGVTGLNLGLAELVSAGVPMKLASLWTGYAAPEDPRAKTKPKLVMKINGANYGKPYPPPGGAAALPKPNPPRPKPAPQIIAAPAPVSAAPAPKAASTPAPAAPAAMSAPKPVSSPTSNPIAPAPHAPVARQMGATMQDPNEKLAWLRAWQEAQRQTAEAHSAWQSAMASSHAAYLKTAETSFLGLGALIDPSLTPALHASLGAPAFAAPAPSFAPQTFAAPQAFAPAPSYAAPAQGFTPPSFAAPMPSAAAPLPAPRPATPPAVSVATAPNIPLTTLTAAPKPAPIAAAAPRSSGGVDLHGIMMAVVSEKTGYPIDMLGPEMDLEADLGVDSIKRVEILSAVRERAPGLPEVDAGGMASLRTLGQIVSHLGASMPGLAAAAPAPAASKAAPAAAPAAPKGNSLADLKPVLLSVVAEKTGYPVDMLGWEMDLEADLGVDSIKRVEILSAVRERSPGLPEVDAGAMASLRTLGQIVEHLGATLPAGNAASAAPVAAPAAAAPSKGGSLTDLKPVLLAVVAEKTGYPVDMLGWEMDLEADLGVDSIKRVEILSAVRERSPGLPEVDAGAMASLRTLGQIVEHLGASFPASAAAPAAAVNGAGKGSASNGAGHSVASLKPVLLAVVSEKTGYPVDMLGWEMDLEADLGVDSIKRVEILSAVRERSPGLPEVDAGAMASLRTLGQIVDHLGSSFGGPSSVAAAVSAPVVLLEAPINPRLGRFALRLIDAPALGFALPGLLDAKRLCVIDGGSGVGNALVARLQAEGIGALLLADPTEDADGVIFLGGLNPSANDDDAIAINRAGFRAARSAAKRLSQGGIFVTVQDTGGDFGLSGSDRAVYGGLAGLAKTALIEWPKASVRALDLAVRGRDAAAVAAQIADELLGGGAGTEVALGADGARRTLISVREAVIPADMPLGRGDLVLASGGARGVTAATLIALAKDTGCTLVLLGRTALENEGAATVGAQGEAGLKKALLEDAKARAAKVSPAEINRAVSKILANREIHATLAAVSAVGAQAIYVPADVQDGAAVAGALRGLVAKHGPVRAIVHGAGVIQDKLIAEKTDAQFDAVFDTKVLGLRALLAAVDSVQTDGLRAIVLFSSVAGRCGNNGQVDYAMANEVLNKWGARLRKERGIAVKSLGWGPWEGGMVTPQLKARFEQLGVALIPLAVGAKMLVDELRAAQVDDVELVLGGEPKAEALIAEDAHKTTRFEVSVRRDRFPMLADHAVRGAVVLPVVFAIELFARAARAMAPTREVAAVTDVKVLKGVRLLGYEGAGDRLFIDVTESGDGFAMTMRSASGPPHYSAKVELANGSAKTPGVPADPKAMGAFSDTVYGDVLFHGPTFQVIRGMSGVSDDGLVANLSGLRGMGWSGLWETDPALLDGGLQLALLFTRHRLGGASLPTSVGSLRVWKAGPSDGALRAVLLGKSVSSSKVTSDIAFVDAGGALVAELRGVETHLLPPAAQA